jgi:2,3-bisphosphoglycerate-dependent phosphoglycerate mutase
MAAPRQFPQRPFSPPPGSLDLLLVRHGASAPFVTGRDFPLVDGHGDPELAPEGHEQAAQVGKRLAGEGIQAVYVSTLRRTAQTAAPLLDLLGMRPRVEPDLREVMLGEWEGGLFRQKVADGDPIALRMAEEQRWGVIPGAEEDEAFAARVRAAVVRLAAAHADQRVVAVTHGGVIGQILHQATGSRPFAFSNADNGSISQVVVAGDRWVVRRFNDTAHLTPSFSVTAAPPI